MIIKKDKTQNVLVQIKNPMKPNIKTVAICDGNFENQSITPTHQGTASSAINFAPFSATFSGGDVVDVIVNDTKFIKLGSTKTTKTMRIARLFIVSSLPPSSIYNIWYFNFSIIHYLVVILQIEMANFDTKTL